MPRIISLSTCCLLSVGVASAAPLQAAPSDRAALEQKFDANVNADEMRDWMKLLASEPNQVGSPHDKANADYILSLVQDSWAGTRTSKPSRCSIRRRSARRWSWSRPSISRPRCRSRRFRATRSATATDPALPAYVAYQGDGDVTAALVYVNYGMQDDYKMLERLGVSVKGKIVIARYGAGWRGLKPKLAQEHGAVGCIIYSDPADDGYSVDETYPAGPMRPPQGFQRGSVADMPLYPGDPLTPGVGATEGRQAARPISEAHDAS